MLLLCAFFCKCQCWSWCISCDCYLFPFGTENICFIFLFLVLIYSYVPCNCFWILVLGTLKSRLGREMRFTGCSQLSNFVTLFSFKTVLACSKIICCSDWDDECVVCVLVWVFWYIWLMEMYFFLLMNEVLYIYQRKICIHEKSLFTCSVDSDVDPRVVTGDFQLLANDLRFPSEKWFPVIALE